ncbi:helix-turn-helix transcriptional regulator [Mucilaginibacter litoreus]|uniref:Helix-turn-helix transcriptional regulator n=1 Tax=Mucilaginibacter litoreus TaxID=1048221 RepID=A0ABW3AN64_9SPHI
MDYLKTLRNNNKIFLKTIYFSTDKHIADDFTMRCVLTGNENCNIGYRNILLDPDSVLILNKGTSYASTVNSEVPVKSFSISFDEKFITDFNNSIRLNSKQLLDVKENATLLSELRETLYPFKGDLRLTVLHLKDYLDNNVVNEMLINEYLHHCLITYNSLYNNEVLKKAEQLHVLNQATRIEVIRRLNIAKEILYSNYYRNISLEELAENACLSVNHLLRTFKQAFNQTPHQYLTDIRLSKARYMLKRTDCPVNEIANTIGFESTSSFIRLFKKKMSTTPVAYRQTA